MVLTPLVHTTGGRSSLAVRDRLRSPVVVEEEDEAPPPW